MVTGKRVPLIARMKQTLASALAFTRPINRAETRQSGGGKQGRLATSTAVHWMPLSDWNESHVRVWAALDAHDKDHDGVCDPSVRWVALHAKMSPSNAARILKHMTEVDAVTIENRGRDTIRYRCAPALFAKDAAERATGHSTAGGTQRADGTRCTDTREEGLLESLVERGESEGTADFRKNIHTVSFARDARPPTRAPTQVRMLLPISTGRRPRPASASADPAALKKHKRDTWLGTLGEYVRDVEPNELERFWTEAMKPAEEARAYLNAIDQRMRDSWWWRERLQRRDARGRAR
jgi:hypothetical protein